MHRDEAARILREVLVGDEALTDRRHLELELDQLRIEQLEQDVVRPFAVNRGKLETFIVQPLLNACLRSNRRNLVVFVGRPFHIVHRRVVPRAERSGDHLRDADVFRPRDALGLPLAQLSHAEVTALTLQSVIGEDLLHLLAVGERRELGVPERRAHLDALDANLREDLREAGKVAVLDHGSVRIGLTADGQTQRVRVEIRDVRGDKPGHGGVGRRHSEELAS